MGIPLDVFRLVRLDGDGGCEHHLLVRAGRPSYPNASQRADDAANDLPELLIDGLIAWALRWRPFADCRSGQHGSVLLGETMDGVVDPEPTDVDLHTDVGMRTLDLWVAENPNGEIAIGATADAATFWAAVEADGTEVTGLLRPGRGMRALLLTDRSGGGDLRDI